MKSLKSLAGVCSFLLIFAHPRIGNHTILVADMHKKMPSCEMKEMIPKYNVADAMYI